MTRLAAVLVLLLLAPAPAAAQSAEQPRYELGEKWVRSDGAFELTRRDGGGDYVFTSEDGREIHVNPDTWITLVRWPNDEQPPWSISDPPRLSWPLRVGQKGTSRGGIFFGADGGGQATFTWEVEKYEEVTVPAGTFKAFRIAVVIERQVRTLPVFVRGQAPIPGGVTSVYYRFKTWYAPEARQHVKATGRGVGPLAYQVVAIEKPVLAPLRIALPEPADGATATRSRSAVRGVVSAGAGVRTVTVSLNNAQVFRDEAPAPAPSMSLDVPLMLREGKNVVTVTAVDGAGDTRQEARVLFYERPVETAAAPPPSAPTPSPIEPRPVTPAVTAAVPPAPPLRVALTSPADQARFEQASVTLAAVASGGRGISEVVVSLNGVEVSRRREPTPPRALAVNLPLTLRDGQNTLVVAATDTAGALEQEVRSVHFEKRVPLAIALRYPEDRARFTEAASVVAALVTSSKGVLRSRVVLNGAEVAKQAERVPQKSVVITTPITLREGANVITLAAEEPDGTVRQELRTVFYDKPKVAAVPVPPPAPPPPRADRWAVVIGVGAYDSPGIPRLKYSVPDADAIYQTLVADAGFKKDNVLLLTDRTERKPTLKNIKWALGTFLSRSARKDDTVFIFFAGHGAPEVDTRGLERDGLAKYLIPSDAESDDLYSSALPMDELSTIFQRIEAERVVAFLDACYSGAAGGRTFASKKTRAGAVDDLFLDRLTRSKGRAIITASRPAEVSIELPELGHGIFTYYLVQGLKGAGDLNRDGIVSLQELYEYVEQQVAAKSRAVGGNQHPVMKGELEGVLPLVKVRGR